MAPKRCMQSNMDGYLMAPTGSNMRGFFLCASSLLLQPVVAMALFSDDPRSDAVLQKIRATFDVVVPSI